MINSEDHIDDLFRQARENYPLKTGNGDWDSVLNELKKQTGETAILKSKVKVKFKWRLLWLLLLLPLGWLSSTKFPANKDSSVLTKSGKKLSITTTNSTHKMNPTDNEIIVSPKTTNRVNNSTLSNNKINFSKINITAKNNKFLYKNVTKSNSAENVSTFNSIQQNIGGIENEGMLNNNLIGSQPIEPAGLENTDHFPGTPTNKHQTLNNVTNHLLPLQNTAIIQGFPKEKVQLSSKGTSSSLSADSSQAKNKMVRRKASQIKKGLYVGVLGGPDISTIKLQPVKSTGYSLGILIGYRLNKRFSLETNFLWDKKNYYTDGKYVNKQNLSLPSNVSIINLNGYCHMYELDLTGRYDFTPYKKQHFFARGGLASYFMKKQDYSYLASWSNGPPYTHNLEYGNATNNIFSVLHISAGYEYKVGKISLRIEPYLKIPTVGLGRGKLPVTSMSLYMGISVPLH